MSVGSLSFDAARLTRSRIATAGMFIILGLLQGALAARMPAIKAHAGLTDGLLGLALLGLPAGSVLAIQFTGRLIARWGSSPVTTVGAVVLCAGIVAPPYATGFVTLLPALVLFGIGMGLTDTAMNAHAVVVENAYGRRIMSSFHGYYSVGALTGALGGSLTAHAGIGAGTFFLADGGLCLLLLIGLRGWLLPGSADVHSGAERDAGSHRAPWTTALALLAAVAFLALLAELAVADWSAVYLRDHLGSAASTAALGYAFFAFAMLMARFFGDGVISRLGPAQVLRWGGLGAGIALGIGLLTDSVPGALAGWAVVGIGMSGVVPIAFSTAGNLKGVPSADALSKVAGVGYLGSMFGPPLIGLLAQATTLEAALFLSAAASVIIGVIGPLAIRRSAAVGGPATATTD